MNDVRSNAADFPFLCPICNHNGYIRGQPGGNSLVKTSCPASHVFHLKCFTQWVESEQQAAINLDQRQCTQCLQPALPLIRLDGESVLDDESHYCESMMLNACRTGNLGNLKMLLREDEALAKRTYRSALTGHPEHPLTVAINYGHTDCVRALIDSHADVNAANHNGVTPLNIAARQRRTDYLQMLTRAGANIINLLRTAVWEGNTDLLKYLSSTQPGQLALDKALREAAIQGQTQCLEILIKAGAKDLDDALYSAVLAENIESQNILVEQGADITTLLHTAVRKGSLECIDNPIFLRYVNATDKKGRTPLHIAAAKSRTKCLKKLIKTGRVNINIAGKFGWTALHLAVRYASTETVMALLGAGGIKVNEKTNAGWTVLHLAARYASAKTVIALLSAEGIKVNEKTKANWTALHLAAKYASTKTVIALLFAEGIKVNEREKYNWTALHLAARYGRTKIVKALLNVSDIQINEQTDTGSTALSFATRYGHTTCKKLLTENGAINNQSFCLLQ
ncbi:ankyrin repeat domain-containing protein [Endozoicomonas sp. ALB115]|uniref:ankyrin repeat domain-containing protein n=1 Tax=Endozoicomonas sp. ALB115 TaxID=3403074 RepID=UPI003BB663B8